MLLDLPGPALRLLTAVADFHFVCGVLSLRHFRLARWCSLSLGGWWPRNPARRI
jgi:hypothetical protein